MPDLARLTPWAHALLSACAFFALQALIQLIER